MNATTENRPATKSQFRLPKPGKTDPWWDCNRSFWNQRVLPGPHNNFTPDVKSIVVKQPGRKRGVRFIIFESAADYFERLRKEQLGAQC